MRTPITTELKPIVDLPERAPKTPLDAWVVVAYCSTQDHWKIFKEQWISQEAACRFAEKLHPIWQHRKIFRLQAAEVAAAPSTPP
jgi:hypothetical protein